MQPSAAYTRAAALCSASEVPASAVRRKLLTWGIAASAAQTILARLESEGFLNEQRYANAFCHDKFMFNGWGRLKIAATLRQQGISAQCAQQALEQIGDEEYEARLRDLLGQKWRAVRHRQPQAAIAALMRYGASRGFEPSLVTAISREIAQAQAGDGYED